MTDDELKRALALAPQAIERVAARAFSLGFATGAFLTAAACILAVALLSGCSIGGYRSHRRPEDDPERPRAIGATGSVYGEDAGPSGGDSGPGTDGGMGDAGEPTPPVCRERLAPECQWTLVTPVPAEDFFCPADFEWVERLRVEWELTIPETLARCTRWTICDWRMGPEMCFHCQDSGADWFRWGGEWCDG